MLVIERSVGDEVVIDGRVRIRIRRIKGSSKVRLAIDAPPEVRITRAELCDPQPTPIAPR